MVKKLKKYVKFIVCCTLILSLIAPSYAALSASDGSAFVTKAEFDSALADFNARLTTFEAGINSKIDSQVTSYLDRNGIWNGKTVTFVNNLKVQHGTYKNKWGVGLNALKCGANQNYLDRKYETITQADLENPPSPFIGALDSWKGNNYRRYTNQTKTNNLVTTNMVNYMPEDRQEWYAANPTGRRTEPVQVAEVMLGTEQDFSLDLPKSGMLFLQSVYGNCDDSMGRWGIMFGLTDYLDAAGKVNDPGWSAQLNLSYPSFSLNTYVCELKAGETKPTTFAGWQEKIVAKIDLVTVSTWPVLSKGLNYPYYSDPETKTVDPSVDGNDPWFIDNPNVVGMWQVSMNTGLSTNTFFVSKNSNLYLVSTFGYAFKFQFVSWEMQTMAHHVQNYTQSGRPIILCSGGIY